MSKLVQISGDTWVDPNQVDCVIGEPEKGVIRVELRDRNSLKLFVDESDQPDTISWIIENVNGERQ